MSGHKTTPRQALEHVHSLTKPITPAELEKELQTHRGAAKLADVAFTNLRYTLGDALERCDGLGIDRLFLVELRALTNRLLDIAIRAEHRAGEAKK